MKIKYLIYKVTDKFGTEDFDVANSPSCGIQICGMKDKYGEDVYFESEAYHLEEWCNSNNLEYDCIEKSEII